MCLSAIRRVKVRGLKFKCLQRRGQQLNKVKQLEHVRIMESEDASSCVHLNLLKTLMGQ